MRTIAISVFKATCLKVLKQVQQTGEPVLVTKLGAPIAQIQRPAPSPSPKGWVGRYRGKGHSNGDVVGFSTRNTWNVLKS